MSARWPQGRQQLHPRERRGLAPDPDVRTPIAPAQRRGRADAPGIAGDGAEDALGHPSARAGECEGRPARSIPDICRELGDIPTSTLYHYLHADGAIRQWNPEAPASSSRGLDQPAGRGYDATACSVNPNRRCLNVVDRFRNASTHRRFSKGRGTGGATGRDDAADLRRWRRVRKSPKGGACLGAESSRAILTAGSLGR